MFVNRTQCPVCAGSDIAEIYRAPYDSGAIRELIASNYRQQGTVDFARLAGEEFVVAACRVCDLLFQQRVPTDAMLGHVYNEMIDPAALQRIERDLVTLDSVEKIAGEMAVLFRRIGKPPTDITLLDYGAGYSRWGRVARGMGATVYATEIGEEKRAHARGLGIAMIEDEAIDTMRFDIVHTEQVLEHLTEPGRDFARLARATAGLFKAAIPPCRNLADLLARNGMPSQSLFAKMMEGGHPTSDDAVFNALQPLEHLNAFSPRTMAWMGERNGLRLVSRVRMGSVGVDLGTPGGWARSAARLARMAGKALFRPDTGYYLFAKG